MGVIYSRLVVGLLGETRVLMPEIANGLNISPSTLVYYTIPGGIEICERTLLKENNHEGTYYPG